MNGPSGEPLGWPPTPRERGRTYAIGDIHGRDDLLAALLEGLAPQPTDRLVFLGDYVDRGPDSRAVVDRLLAISQRTRCVFLRGNHDASFASVALGLGRIALRDYLAEGFGGAATMRSYGSTSLRPEELQVPDEHVHFLRDLELHHVEERAGRAFLLTHAGADLGRSMGEQDPMDLLWGKRGFLKDLARHARRPPEVWRNITVVFGHYSHLDGYDHRPVGIGIDTGCGSLEGGRLSALDLDTLELISVP